MTKLEEIHILAQAAEKLGPFSYCGVWLKDQLDAIEHDMRCDIIPQVSWSETRRKHHGLILEGMEEAKRLKNDATKEAERILGNARKQADLIRSTLRRDLESALGKI